MKISAAVCTYKRYGLLSLAIESLVKQSLEAQAFEIIIVDNSPDADTSAMQARQYQHIENLIWHKEAVAGLSNARNVAARLASSPIIAYLDDDAIADARWLESLCQTFEQFGNACEVVGGRILPIWSSPRPNWLGDRLLGHLSVVDFSDHARVLRDGEWVAGANISFRTDTLRRLGGFDIALGRVGGGASLMSNEEISLISRITSEGGRVVFSPEATVQHLIEAPRLQQGWFRKRVAWQAVSDMVSRATSDSPPNIQSHLSAVKDYFYHCAPSERTIRALFIEKQDPDDFQWQLSAIYDCITCLLGGIEENDYI